MENKQMKLKKADVAKYARARFGVQTMEFFNPLEVEDTIVYGNGGYMQCAWRPLKQAQE